MLVDAATLDSLRVGYSIAYQAAFAAVPSEWQRLATPVSATQREQKYGWLGKLPNVREWVGPRVIQNLMQHDYAIKEIAFELSIGVDKDDIETEQLGMYTPLFAEMGAQAGAFKNKLIFDLLAAGWETECYDGQPFFDTDHPVLDGSGNVITVANTDGGSGPVWFLLDVTRPLKPLIIQTRKEFEFVSVTDLTSPNVFLNKKFYYGIDARMNAGFGFWQMAYGSRQPLNATSYAAARAAMMGMNGDYGVPLGLNPTLLMVSPNLESAGRKLLKNDLGPNGETNEWKDTAELMVSRWLR